MAHPYSLSRRLLLTATLVLLTFLGLMGLVLDQAFRQTAEQNIEERLRIQIYGLLSVTEVIDEALILPEGLQEPRFNHPGSGLYALVLDAEGLEVWRSPSTLDLVVDAPELAEMHLGLAPGSEQFGVIQDISADSRTLFALGYQILWLGSAEQATPYTFLVAESQAIFDREVSRFRNSLWGWLLAVVIALVAVQALVMKWGLAPLDQLARDLKAIEDGDEAFLDGEYPLEIGGVTDNLNMLLASERQQREKYRTTMADLAHSLKTPLAILKGSANQLQHVEPGTLVQVRDTIDDQVARMDQIIGYQLERAVIDTISLIKTSISVEPLITRLVEAMKKVYQDEDVTFEVDVPDVTFFGDERDLMEVLGNCLDNACKYGNGLVKISASQQDMRGLTLVVEDNGQGIEPAARESVLGRGMRLDTRAPGQGIGLAMVAEIVDRYGGDVVIDDSALGGARVTLQFR